MKIITLAEAAKITGLTSEYLSRLCRTGQIENSRLVGKTYIIPAEWAEALAAQKEATLSAREAANVAGVSVQTIYLAIASGKIKKTGRRIAKQSLQEYIISRQKIKDTPGAPAGA